MKLVIEMDLNSREFAVKGTFNSPEILIEGGRMWSVLDELGQKMNGEHWMVGSKFLVKDANNRKVLKARIEE